MEAAEASRAATSGAGEEEGGGEEGEEEEEAPGEGIKDGAFGASPLLLLLFCDGGGRSTRSAATGS